MTDVQPLPLYKEPFIYTGLLTIISTLIAVYSFMNSLQNIVVYPIVFAVGFAIATFYLFDLRCPYCKKPFSKREKILTINTTKTASSRRLLGVTETSTGLERERREIEVPTLFINLNSISNYQYTTSILKPQHQG